MTEVGGIVVHWTERDGSERQQTFAPASPEKIVAAQNLLEGLHKRFRAGEIGEPWQGGLAPAAPPPKEKPHVIPIKPRQRERERD